MNSAVMVTVTVSTAPLQLPPAGETLRPGGSPLVTSVCRCNDSLISVSIHFSGCCAVNTNTTGSVAGIIVVELNAPAVGAGTTVGSTRSLSSGGDGGTGCPAEIGAGVLSS